MYSDIVSIARDKVASVPVHHVVDRSPHALHTVPLPNLTGATSSAVAPGCLPRFSYRKQYMWLGTQEPLRLNGVCAFVASTRLLLNASGVGIRNWILAVRRTKGMLYSAMTFALHLEALKSLLCDRRRQWNMMRWQA